MGKATVQDMLDEGFRPEQFGSPAEFATADGGYLARVLADCARWVAAQVGDALYPLVAADSYAADCIRLAEIQRARAVLYKRRIAFFDAAGNVGLQQGPFAERRQYALDAADAEMSATYYIGEAVRALGGDVTAQLPGTGASLGVVETGRYAPVAETLG